MDKHTIFIFILKKDSLDKDAVEGFFAIFLDSFKESSLIEKFPYFIKKLAEFIEEVNEKDVIPVLLPFQDEEKVNETKNYLEQSFCADIEGFICFSEKDSELTSFQKGGNPIYLELLK